MNRKEKKKIIMMKMKQKLKIKKTKNRRDRNSFTNRLAIQSEIKKENKAGVRSSSLHQSITL